MQLVPVEYEDAPPRLGEASPEAAPPPRLVEVDPMEAPPRMAEAPSPQTASKPGSFTRGIVTSVAQQNPELLAEALEMGSHLAPETFKSTLQSGSEWLRNLPKPGPEYDLQAPRLREIIENPTFDSAMTWLGEAVGGGIGSSLPSIAAGTVGAGIGGAVAGPPGAIAGAAIGGVGGGLPLNSGEVYRELKREGVPPDVAAQYAKYAGPAMSALDAYSVGKLAQQFGLGEVKRQAARIMARRIVEESAKGAGREGITEALQEIPKQIAVSMETGKPFWSEDNAWDVLESGAAGFVTGGAMSAPAGLRRDQVPPRMADPEVVRQVHDEISGAKVGGAPAPGIAPSRNDAPYGPDEQGNYRAGVWDAVSEPAPTEGRAPKGEAVLVRSSASAVAEQAPPTNEPPAPTFYSQIKKVVEDKLPDSFDAQQGLNTIRNAPGVKPEEMEWLQIPSYLQDKGKVRKADLIAHLEDNAIRIEDVDYGGQINNLRFDPMPLEEIRYQPHEGRAAPEIVAAYRPTSGVASDVDGRYIIVENAAPSDDDTSLEAALQRVGATHAPFTVLEQYFDGTHRPFRQASTLEEAQGLVTRAIQVEGGQAPQYAGWQAVKGGQNYREKLLRFATPAAEKAWQARELGQPVGVSDRDAERWNRTIDAAYHSQHWEPTNVLAHTRMADFTDVEGKRGLLLQEVQSDWHQAGRKRGYGDRAEDRAEDRVPDAPFKTSWAELVVKRMLRQAADEGYDRVYVAPGKLQAELYRQMGEKEEGQVEFYDNILPRIMEKWAKKLGGRTGKTEVIVGYDVLDPTAPPRADGGVYTFSTPQEASHYAIQWGTEVTPKKVSVFYVDLTPQMLTNVRRGLPMFSMIRDAKKEQKSEILKITPITTLADGTEAMPIIEAATKIVFRIADRMNMPRPTILVTPVPGAYGEALHLQDPTTGEASYAIKINPSEHATGAQIYSTLAHEFGHIIMWEKFNKADFAMQQRIRDDYNRYRREFALSGDSSMGNLYARRDNFIMQQEARMSASEGVDFNSLAPERREYWLGFEEWFAEQVARYFTVPETKAMNVVEKFFERTAKALRQMYETFQRLTGRMAEPSAWVRAWLDSLITEGEPALWKIYREAEAASRERNAQALRAIGVDDSMAEPESPLSGPMRTVMSSLSMTGPSAQQARASIAGVDHYNRFFKWMLSIQQLAERNPLITSLNTYKELWQTSTLERQTIMDDALVTVRAWKKLSNEQSDGLANLIDDYMNMRYLSQDEKDNGVSRHPTAQEFASMVAQYKLSNETVLLFKKIQADFRGMLVKYRDLLNAEALKISDPQQRAAKLRDVQAQFDALDKVPYFPAMRFGDLTLEHRDITGKLIAFYTFETKRQRAKEMAKLQKKIFYGEKLHAGKLPEDVGPLMGLPPGLLDLLNDKLGLSSTQKAMLEVIKFELAPAQSFKHRFERKNRVPGYSEDFRRAYATYFFHGSNHLTRLKYLDPMREVVNSLRKESRAMLDGTKRMMIADYVNDHLNYSMNPKADWSTLRALTFLWALGFSPAAALINTTQVLIGSLPFLGAKFGDVKAMAALGKAMAQTSTYYKQGTIKGHTDRDLKALAEAIKEGIITEAMAPELAALSEGNNLEGSVGGTARQAFMWVMEKSAYMFEKTEQWNRRVTFRAAWKLASENPSATFVKEAVNKHRMQYDRLITAMWTPHDAASFVAAKEVVESTQYIYGQYAQPRFMRGKLRTVFIFKSFLQNTLFMLWNNPAVAARSLLIMAGIGGLMGLPGMEDLKGWLKVLSTRLLGKNFDLDDWVRKHAIETLNGTIPADLILHGISRYGFGIPAAMQMVGMNAPKMDLSRGVSLGNILPLDPWAAFGESVDPQRGMLDSVQKASGASFGAAFNIWKAVQDVQSDPWSMQRYIRAMPRAMQGAARSYQAFNTGMIPGKTGRPIIRFDPHDPMHMAEILGMAGGWQPLRLTAEWDRIIATREAVAYWDIRRNMLLRQFGAAVIAKNKDDVQSVRTAIDRFNAMLPEVARGKAITPDTLSRSVQTKIRQNALSEQGLSAQRSNWPIEEEIRRLHPEADVNVRRVR